jgi:alpha-galactosidase
MREEIVQEYLEERVINQLEQWGFDYLKVDYNDNIGIGCDGAESLGEGLRQNMEASQKFWRRLGERLPNLVIENCSSGGHRLEPSMQALASMASFSDAHEWKAIPVIAANVTRAILPAQSQIWAVLRKDDDEKRLYYSLACTFLGRMCLSGDVYDLQDFQWEIVQKAIHFYKVCAPVIKQGRNYRMGPHVKSYNHLKGWQAVCRKSTDEKRILVVLHAFEECETSRCVSLAGVADGHWKIKEVFARCSVNAQMVDNCLKVNGLQEYDGLVCLLEKM